MDSGHADVRQPLHSAGHRVRGDCGFLRHRKVARPGSGDENGLCRNHRLGGAFQVNGASHRIVFRAGQRRKQRPRGGLIDAGDKNAVSPLRDAGCNGDDLLGALPRPVDHFGKALPECAVMVDRREAQRLEGLGGQRVERPINRN